MSQPLVKLVSQAEFLYFSEGRGGNPIFDHPAGDKLKLGMKNTDIQRVLPVQPVRVALPIERHSTVNSDVPTPLAPLTIVRSFAADSPTISRTSIQSVSS